MKLSDLIAECRRRGVSLRLEGDVVKARPGDRLGGGLLEALRHHKPVLRKLLADHEPTPPVGTWDSLLARAIVAELLEARAGLQSLAAWEAVSGIENQIDDCFLAEDLAGLQRAAGQWRKAIADWKGAVGAT